MLSIQLKEQIQNVLNPIDDLIELCMYKSKHLKQKDLEEFLNTFSLLNENIKIVQLNKISVSPSFYIKNKKKQSIKFTGIPLGHELSSFLLALLNSNGKGKFPDQSIISRIKALKGPINLKSFISLSCENCPDVVQALNLMAIIHENFTHDMIDANLDVDERERLNIQGFPAVLKNDEILFVGKQDLNSILEKLEKNFGSQEYIQEKELGEFDVCIIGAGPAGVSAAIYSARKGLKTLLIGEKVGGQLRETKGIENLISNKYIEGLPLSQKLYEHLAEYEVTFLENRKVDYVTKEKKIITNYKEIINAKSVIIATGAKWRNVNVPGEKEFIGKGLAYCPHCDGPLFKNKKVAVIGGGNSGVEAAIDLAGMAKEVIILEYDAELKADSVLVNKAKSKKNISVITNAQTLEFKGEDILEKIIYKNREDQSINDITLDGVFVQIGLVPNSKFIQDVVSLNDYGEIIIDSKCSTNIKGIFAAGDVSSVPYKQIIISMGEGAKAALSAFEYLKLTD